MNRHGFTLIEVLIALGLSVLLLSVVYAAIDLFFLYNEAGRAEVRGLQLSRSLTRLMSDDLNSVAMQPPEVATDSGTEQTNLPSITPSTWSASSSTNETQGSASLSFAGIGESGTPVCFGIVGTEELLHITVSLPARDLNYAAVFEPDVAMNRVSNLQLITYGLTPIDSETLRRLEKNIAAKHPGIGLGRRVRDLYSQDSTTDTLSSENLIAPEVTEILFRYFNGTDWVESWDSQILGELPRAIEVQLGFWNPPMKSNAQSARVGDGNVIFFIHTFYLPLSIPTVEGAGT